MKVGLIGFRTVGAGVVKILEGNGRLIEERLGAQIKIERVATLK